MTGAISGVEEARPGGFPSPPGRTVAAIPALRWGDVLPLPPAFDGDVPWQTNATSSVIVL